MSYCFLKRPHDHSKFYDALSIRVQLTLNTTDWFCGLLCCTFSPPPPTEKHCVYARLSPSTLYLIIKIRRQTRWYYFPRPFSSLCEMIHFNFITKSEHEICTLYCIFYNSCNSLIIIITNALQITSVQRANSSIASLH